MKNILLILFIIITTSTAIFAQDVITSEEEIANEGASDASAIASELEEESYLDMQVVASRIPKRISDTAADVTVIGQEQLKASGSTDITDILRENGIVAIDSMGSRKDGDQIYIQGMDSSRMLIIIDGQRVRGGSMGGITALKRLPISSIESIEIVKGPSSFLWGSDAQAGVIYITTKKGSGQSGLHGSAGIIYKNNFYLDNDNNFVQPYFNLSYGWDTGSAWLGSSFEYADSWLSPYTVFPIPLPTGTQYYNVKNERENYINFDIYGGFNINISDKHNLEFTTKYQQEVSPIRDMYTTVDDNLFRKFMGNISYTYYILDNLDLNLSTGISYDEENRTSHNQRLQDYYIFNDNEAFVAYYLNDMFTLKGGYTLDFQYFKESEDKSYNQQNHDFFFGTDIDIDTVIDIDITAGVRYQLNLREASGFTDNDPLHSFSPELGIVIKPHEMVAIKGNVGHSFKVPELITAFRDYFDHTWFYVGANPDLQPESSWGYSGVVEVYPLKNMSFSAGIFRNDLQNLIDYDYNTGIYYNSLPVYLPINIGQAYTWGVNAAANAVFQIPVFGQLSYTFNFEYLIAAKQVLD